MENTGDSIEGVEVLLTQTTTQLSVSLEAGDAELNDAAIIVFPEDESRRWYGSPFVRTVRTSQRRSVPQRLQWNDRRSLTMTGLPPGRYYAIAVALLERGQETSPALLRQLSTIASRLELGEGATQTIALKMTPLP